MANNGKKIGNMIALAGLCVTLLFIFAGLVTTINQSQMTGAQAAENKEQIKIIGSRVGDQGTEIKVVQSQLSDIKAQNEKIEKKVDELLRRGAK